MNEAYLRETDELIKKYDHACSLFDALDLEDLKESSTRGLDGGLYEHEKKALRRQLSKDLKELKNKHGIK